ncbi:MAG: hypothetical protein O2967_17040 [Proteobacteria bacterium]|nr:hypothetical protein [Pseudomonadota bacterium]
MVAKVVKPYLIADPDDTGRIDAVIVKGAGFTDVENRRVRNLDDPGGVAGININVAYAPHGILIDEGNIYAQPAIAHVQRRRQHGVTLGPPLRSIGGINQAHFAPTHWPMP